MFPQPKACRVPGPLTVTWGLGRTRENGWEDTAGARVAFQAGLPRRGRLGHVRAALGGFPASAHSFEITHSSQDLPWEQRKIHDLGPGPLPPAAASSLHVALHRGAGRRYAFARKHLRFLWISFRNFF